MRGNAICSIGHAYMPVGPYSIILSPRRLKNALWGERKSIEDLVDFYCRMLFNTCE